MNISEFMKTVTYLWRLLLMSLIFALSGAIGLILGYVIMPVWSLLTKNKQRLKYRVQALISFLFNCLITTIQKLGLIKIRFINFNLLSQEKGVLFIANHPTFLDYIVITSQLRRCDNIVKEALWRNPLAKKTVSMAGYIPNLQSADTFEAVKTSLKNGNNILMFPEGTRTDPNKPITFKRGAAQIAIRANVAIRIIHIECNPPVLTKQDKWYKATKTVPELILTVGGRIEPKDFKEHEGMPSLEARKLTRYLQEQFVGG
jgi:1-acyl-sn-glycerol-3-phosphate acyltransferase